MSGKDHSRCQMAPKGYLDRFNARASEQIAEYRIEAWINKELGEDK
jgi:hypothetical protein